MPLATGQLTQNASPDQTVLNSRQYRLWEEMLENRTGVRIKVQREGYVRTEIVKRMTECGWVDADSYFREVLETLNGPREWSILLDRLLIKDTRFFRHQPSHDYVRDRIASRAEADPAQTFNIWSAGCASGEESYSLALDASEGFTMAGQADNYYIVGTDVSSDAIATARKGIYSNSRIDNLSLLLKQKYFLAVDDQCQQITKPVRQRVAFLILNLLEQQQQYHHQMDLIFCQNVLIYFKQWRRRDIVNIFEACLKPGGCLIIGPGELTDWESENMTRIDRSGIQAYEKVMI